MRYAGKYDSRSPCQAEGGICWQRYYSGDAWAPCPARPAIMLCVGCQIARYVVTTTCDRSIMHHCWHRSPGASNQAQAATVAEPLRRIMSGHIHVEISLCGICWCRSGWTAAAATLRRIGLRSPGPASLPAASNHLRSQHTIALGREGRSPE
jgi:hypothetical protein